MQIKKMFRKEIDRELQGVIVVGQGAETNVAQELEEYVVTRAALLFTAGAAEVIAKGVVKAYTSNGATLSVLLYLRAFEDGDFDSAWGIGAVLLVLVLAINLAARLAKTKLKQKQ